MSTVSVIVPWSGNCPHRVAAWKYVSSWYRTYYPDWEIVRGDAGGGPWCKARAVAAALHRTQGRILVIADADCIAPGLPDAVEAVKAGEPWAMPHHLVHRFSARTTAAILSGDLRPEDVRRHPDHYAQRPYSGYPGGGITVLNRETYLSAPLDPRFTGWGQEDEAWALALDCLHGAPWRRRLSPLWHLWHPPQQRLTRAVGSRESSELLQQYKARRDQPERMESHLEVGRKFTRSAEAAHPDGAPVSPGGSRPVSGRL